ncbi:MAG: DUF484 family protein [Methylomicrobium sp.]
MNEATSTLTPDQVEAYLRDNPEFFNDHLALLESLTIPHPSGDAISLISKQLEIFRSKHQELENQLTALIEIARDNDTSFNRMHKLTLALLDAGTLEEAVANLEHVFLEYFLTDFVSIRIVGMQEHSSLANLFVAPHDPNLQHFLPILNNNQPKCGRPTLAQARFLFGDVAHEVKSTAIIPMSYTELEGLVAIGSREENRFHYTMGNLFLTQMSEIIATRLISLLHQN